MSQSIPFTSAYAVLRVNDCIIGTGITREAALDSAAPWLFHGAPSALVNLCDARDGDLVCIPCTVVLHTLYQYQGHGIPFTIEENAVAAYEMEHVS